MVTEKKDKVVVWLWVAILMVGVSLIVVAEHLQNTQSDLPMGVWVTEIKVGDSPGTSYYPTSTGDWVPTPTGLMKGDLEVIEIPEGY